MSGPLFFVDGDSAGRLSITGSDVRHIRRVLRLDRGDVVRVCDRQGHQYRAQIEEVQSGKIGVAILEELECSSEVGVLAVLGQGVAKGEKMDWIVQKSTELGVSVLVPVNTQRSIVRESPATAKRKIARWQRIACEASKQSGRAKVPHVSEAMGFSDFCRTYADADLKLILWEEERDRGLRDILGKGKTWRQVVVLIGPEGGFSPEEAKEAQRLGFQPAGLGPRILRTETVSLVFLSVLLYHLGELG